MEIYYLLLEAVPAPTNPEHDEFGGAYINCWVRAESHKHAMTLASAYIAQENWSCVMVEELRIANRDWYADEPESMACYDEACRCGVSAVFHVWPLDAE